MRFLLVVAALAASLCAQTRSGPFTPVTANRIIRGAGAPTAGLCAAAADVGKVYVRTNAAAASSSLYVCANTGVATYAWELSGSTGGVTSIIAGTGISVDMSTGAVTVTNSSPGPSVTISTSGPVTDPGGSSAFQFNNAAGALTFSAPAGVAGRQRCYRNATGKSGVITIQMPASNTVDLNGANGSSAGTLVSNGALADAVCIVSDAANHWYAYIQSGLWSTT